MLSYYLHIFFMPPLPAVPRTLEETDLLSAKSFYQKCGEPQVMETCEIPVHHMLSYYIHVFYVPPLPAVPRVLDGTDPFYQRNCSIRSAGNRR